MTSAVELLEQWLPDVAADKIVLSDNPAEECGGNMWSFSFSNEQAGQLSPKILADFVRSVLHARERDLIEHHGRRPMLFYCWVDEQAGQLRFSLISTAHTARPPFGCRIDRADQLEEITAEFLRCPYLEGIPIPKNVSESAEAMNENRSPPPEFVLNVWMTTIPITAHGTETHGTALDRFC